MKVHITGCPQEADPRNESCWCDKLKEQDKQQAKQVEQTIDLDCAPGFPRPGDLIEGVIKDTGLPLRETVSRIFGNWTWDYSDIAPEVWEKARPILKERITTLYKKGVIRYGSW